MCEARLVIEGQSTIQKKINTGKLNLMGMGKFPSYC